MMNIFSFTAHFGTENDCSNHFKVQRDKQGVKCKKCGCQSKYIAGAKPIICADMKKDGLLYTFLPTQHRKRKKRTLSKKQVRDYFRQSF